MWFVPYDCQAVYPMIFVDFADQKFRNSLRDQVITKDELALHFEHICQDLSGLTGTDVGAGEDEIEFYIQTAKRFGDLSHFFASFVGKRPLTIRGIIGCGFINSNRMADNIEVHVISPKGMVDLA